MPQLRYIEQAFWVHPQLPQIELRSTRNSPRAYKMHSHAGLSIGAMIDGTTRVSYRGAEHHLQPGQLIFIEPDEPHSCNPPAGQHRSYHMLYLEQHWCLAQLTQLYAQPVSQLRCQPFIISEPLLFARYQAFVDAIQHPAKTFPLAEANAFLLSLLDRCYHASSAAVAEDEDKMVRYLRQRLLQDLSAKPSLQELADEVQLSRETVIRLFKKAVGMPPMAFADNARILLAKTLLREGMPVADVAQATGFSDQSHFHKTFTAYTTATPGQYQQARSIFDNIR